jgi:hypothetical protein
VTGVRAVLRVLRPYVGEVVREIGDVVGPTLVLLLPPGILTTRWEF